MCVLCAIQQVLTHTAAPQNPCAAPTTQQLSLLHYLCGQQLHTQLPEAESTYFCVAMGVFRCSSVQFQKSITILSFCYASSFIHGYVKAFNHGPGKRKTNEPLHFRTRVVVSRAIPSRPEGPQHPDEQITALQNSTRALRSLLPPLQRSGSQPGPPPTAQRPARERPPRGAFRGPARRLTSRRGTGRRGRVPGRRAEAAGNLLTEPRSARGLPAARGASCSRLRFAPPSRTHPSGASRAPGRLRALPASGPSAAASRARSLFARLCLSSAAVTGAFRCPPRTHLMAHAQARRRAREAGLPRAAPDWKRRAGRGAALCAALRAARRRPLLSSRRYLSALSAAVGERGLGVPRGPAGSCAGSPAGRRARHAREGRRRRGDGGAERGGSGAPDGERGFGCAPGRARRQSRSRAGAAQPVSPQALLSAADTPSCQRLTEVLV